MTMKQMQPSNRGSNDRRIISFLVTATSDNDALDQVADPGTGGAPWLPDRAPPVYDGLPLMDARITPLSERENEWFPGDGQKRLYRADAQYTLNSVAIISQKTNSKPVDLDKATGPNEPTESDNPDKELYSFDVAVTNELEQFPDDYSAFDPLTNPTGQAVQRDAGTGFELVETQGYNLDPAYGYRGFNILRPRASFTLDIRPEDANVTRSYQELVIDSVGKVNNQAFRGYDAGEVLLTAARGESRNNTDWQFSFTFEVRRNREIKLGNDVTFTSVDGWDLIDPWYVEQSIPFNGQLVTFQIARQATVWRVYRRADLRQLII